MDILYIIGTGSEWNNNELKFSLRSIEKNGVNVGRVFLVGHKPDFVSDAVTYIPCDDPYDMKHKNILRKVVYAMEHSDIGSHFLISSDDHYYVQKVDFDKLPVYYRNEDMPDKVVGRQIWSEYHKSLRETRWILTDAGLPTYQTNPHCNTHFNAEIYLRHKDLFDKAMALEYGGELNCIMGNLLIHYGEKPVHFIDSKLSRKSSLEDIATRVKVTNCLSSVDNIATSELAKYLQKTFNKKSIYEL